MSFSAEINASLGLNTSIPLLGGLGDEGISSDAISYTLANAGGNARLGLGLQGKIGYMYNPTTEINLSVAYDNFIWTRSTGDNVDYSISNMPIFLNVRFFNSDKRVDYFEVGAGYGITNINLGTSSTSTTESIGSLGLLVAYGTSFDFGLGKPIDTNFYYRFQFSNGAEMEYIPDTKMNYYVAYLGVQFNYDFNIMK